MRSALICCTAIWLPACLPISCLASVRQGQPFFSLAKQSVARLPSKPCQDWSAAPDECTTLHLLTVRLLPLICAGDEAISSEEE